MKVNRHISISDYDYPLPHELIAQYPVEGRDNSKLLVCRDDVIKESVFRNISQFLPDENLMIFNDTRVIRARLIFVRETGSTIEVFCLEPVSPTAELHGALQSGPGCRWVCLVGNVKRWKSGFLRKHFNENGRDYELRAGLKERLDDGCFLIEFSWDPPDLTFAGILEKAGLVPLPPYIERASSDIDAGTYQTIFAENEGSVAAPTAGLHFTPIVLDDLKKKKTTSARVTLHVGLGTFRPVTGEDVADHIMHSERISVPVSTIQLLMKKGTVPVTAVGTTSVRTIESLYWAGVKLSLGLSPDVAQWDPYSDLPEITVAESLSHVLDYTEKEGATSFSIKTSLLIIPGYDFKLTDIIITNFHQPQSTLLLLVSAFLGERWKDAYNYAISNKFRFLSYGDACLFYR